MRCSVCFQDRGNLRGNRTSTKRARRKAPKKRHVRSFGPSRLTREGCSVVGSKRPLEPPHGTPSISSDATGSLAALPALASSFAPAASAGGPLCGFPAVKHRRLDPQRCNPSGPPREQALQSLLVPLEPVVPLRTFAKRRGGLRHLILNVSEVQASAL